jgi:hypothetical protein
MYDRHTAGIDWRKADGTKDHPVWASVPPVPIETEPCKYDPVVVLALNPIRDESIILSGTAGTEYGRLPWLALSASVLGGHTSNAASGSEGCHSISSIAQLIMSDLQTSMGDDILQMTVCLRDGKEAAGQLKAIYPDEAKPENAELPVDILRRVICVTIKQSYNRDRGCTIA